MFDIGAKPANRRLDQQAIFGVGADRAGQVEQLQGFFQIHITHRPAFGQAGAGRFGHLFRRLATLNIGAKPAIAQADRVVIVKPEDFSIAANTITFHPRRAERPGVAAFGVIRTADKRPPRPGGAH